jgi:hypothetical protein
VLISVLYSPNWLGAGHFMCARVFAPHPRCCRLVITTSLEFELATKVLLGDDDKRAKLVKPSVCDCPLAFRPEPLTTACLLAELIRIEYSIFVVKLAYSRLAS